MRVLGVVARPGPATEDLVERIASELADRGTVATVERAPVGDGAGAVADRRPGPDTGVATAYRLGGDGTWTASGGDRGLWDVLDDLAPDHDYAVVAGFDDAAVPQVVVGDREGGGTALVEAESADAVEVGAVVEALQGTEPRETLSSLVARAKRSPGAEYAGAIATFTGRVRAKEGEDDDPTEFLEFEKYEGVAGERMDRIETELEDREGVQEVLLHHRTGRIDDGEDIVFVVVLAGHRREAFETVEDGIDRLKDEVPIFKREVTVEEEFWVHERE